MAVAFKIDLLTGNLVLVSLPSTTPSTALLTELGDALLTELGDYILYE